MNFSVIIPVYKASDFIEKTIQSVEIFSCVSEIILVEDGSNDGTLELCQNLEKKLEKVKLFTHPYNKNLGAGATRNLGIKKAKNNWIAFLDADDIFLPNRFDKELEYYNNGKDFDGVYGAINAFYSSEEKKKEFLKLFNNDITTVQKPIEPEKLKYLLLQMYKSNQGYFSLDALTIKKSLLIDVGLFNEKLRMHQDTDMIIKLSCKGKLVPGSINKPVSSRGVHENNRITSSASNFCSRKLMYEEIIKWFKENITDYKIEYKLNLDLKCYTFLCSNKSYSVFTALTFLFKSKGLFYNDRYFNLIIKNSKANFKLNKLFIKIKEKIVLTFFKKQSKKYSIFVN